MFDEVEQRLQREAFYMQVEFTLSQLDPLSEHGVVVVDLVCQFADIGISFFSYRLVLVIGRESFYLMEHSVDKRRDLIDESGFSPLFQISSFVIGQMKSRDLLFFYDFLMQVILRLNNLSIVFLPLFQRFEEIAELFVHILFFSSVPKQQRQNSCDNNKQYDE